MKKFRDLARRYISDERGVVTIEWVGIAAVVVLAGIVITTFMMTATRDLGDATATQTDGFATNIAASPTPAAGSFARP
ncbi:MAG: hypothetical protein COA45_03135 [Zetaproteobacteria bacterium]|nr:MAG: hypothetical protein COA45_03135 [Zetaproteobacteria bacterium]